MKQAKRKKLEAAGWRVGTVKEFLTPTKRRRTKRRKNIKRTRTRHWRGTDLVVTYKSGLDRDKDRAIRKALGKYETGSGYALASSERDHTATVPEGDLKRVLRMLKKIRGIKTKRLVQKWVVCR